MEEGAAGRSQHQEERPVRPGVLGLDRDLTGPSREGDLEPHRRHWFENEEPREAGEGYGHVAPSGKERKTLTVDPPPSRGTL